MLRAISSVGEFIMNYIEKELKWDSEYFGCKCARIDIIKELDKREEQRIKELSNGYDFITITNKKELHKNNMFIGKSLKAYLVDVNVRLSCSLNDIHIKGLDNKSNIYNSLNENQEILQIAKSSFIKSRFYNDPSIDIKKSSDIYVNWVKNSFRDKNKYFCVYGKPTEGFLLFSKLDNESLVIELIGVSEGSRGKGIGSKLIQILYEFAHKNNYKKVIVGTQIENISAINFYVKNRFKIEDITYIYHFWS